MLRPENPKPPIRWPSRSHDGAIPNLNENRSILFHYRAEKRTRVVAVCHPPTLLGVAAKPLGDLCQPSNHHYSIYGFNCIASLKIAANKVDERVGRKFASNVGVRGASGAIADRTNENGSVA